MPAAQRESLDIDRLLGDLHRKKRWLDTVIEGLEQAIQSPEIRLIDAVEAAFQDGQVPHVDLAEDDGLLLRALASKVPRRNPALEKRRAPVGATEAA
jgi:hypothetical protein